MDFLEPFETSGPSVSIPVAPIEIVENVAPSQRLQYGSDSRLVMMQRDKKGQDARVGRYPQLEVRCRSFHEQC